MRTLAASLLAALLVAESALAGAGADIEKSLAALSSPYLEARRRAVRTLARSGPAGAARLREHYPRADFRTKALIVDGFAEGSPVDGLPLVYGDLETPDRSIVMSQRRLISAVYGRAREFVRARIAPLRGGGGWRREEHLKALPGPGKSPRAALAEIANAKEEPLKSIGRRLAALVADVDAVRAEMDRRRREGSELTAERAREIERRLVQHDVERAVLAVIESGAAGFYDGLYDTVEELVNPPGTDGADAVSVLLRVLRDAPLPEGGMRTDRGRVYRFLEPLPVAMDAIDMRQTAATCLGDIAGPDLVPTLVELFKKLPEGEYPWDSERVDLAHACAALGEPGPTRIVLEEFELKMSWGGGQWRVMVLGWIAGAQARLGEFEIAAKRYEQAISIESGSAMTWYNLACALSQGGAVERAFSALRTAVERGYGTGGTDLEWMQRDMDLESVRRTEAYKLWLPTVLNPR